MAEGGASTAQDSCNYMLCEKHPDAKVEIYCEQHAVVCCLTCAWKDHHGCRPKPCMLEEAKQKFQDEHISLIDQLMTCSETCNEEVDALEKQIELLEDAETSVRAKFTRIKAETIVKLDDMEQQLTDDIDDFICDKTKQLKDMLSKFKLQKQNIDETKQTIQNLLQTSDPSMVAAFVKLKRIIKTIDTETRPDVRIPTFNVAKEVHSFLNCSAVGSFKSSSDDYENVDSSADLSKEASSRVDEDDEALMSDILPDDKETKPRPRQERSGRTFGKIFRLLKFRGNQQASAKKPTATTNPIPLPLAASGNIEDEEWYHGDITRDVANTRLLCNGDYLLRTKPNSDSGGSDYVLSVCSKIQHHAFIKSVRGGWKFKGRRFSTIEDLIKHLHHTMTPLISASHKVVLQSPVSSKSLGEVGGATAGNITRRSSCIDEEPGYEDVFEAGELIIKEEAREKVIDQVIANFDFKAKTKDELSFQKGEHLNILSTQGDDNWWKARNENGRVGLIPNNYVTKVGEEQAAPDLDEDEGKEGDDSTSPYELWVPDPNAVCEYDCGNDFKWFHGCLPQENAEKRLTSDGDFLVRQHSDGAEKLYILSVFWGTHRHFRYKKTVSGYDEPYEFVIYLMGNEIQLNAKIDVKLRNPILKESWELRNDDIKLLDKIGSNLEGYADIYKGQLMNTTITFPVLIDVTLHVARDSMKEDFKKLFLGAAQILHEFNHPNIAKCLGIAMDYDPVIVVTECMKGGSLLSYLRETSSINIRRKIEICADVAEALVYLQDKKCIHRDVAARKCLVTGQTETVQLSDFEMSSRLDSLHSPSYTFRVPLKWTAPEILKAFQTDYKTLFSLKSDIWSFGILIWEVFSQGKVPYSGLTNKAAVEKMIDGYRMPPPEGTPQFIAELMTRCWNENPEKRPNIKHIVHWLKTALKSSAPENFALPPLPPPVSTRPRSSITHNDTNVMISSRQSHLQSLKEKMRTRPLPPPPPDDTTDSKSVEGRSSLPLPPPPSRRAPPPLPPPLNTDDEEDDFLEPT